MHVNISNYKICLNKTEKKKNPEMYHFGTTSDLLIYFLCSANSLQCDVGSRSWGGAHPSSQLVRGGLHPGQVTTPSQIHIKTNEADSNVCTLTPTVNLTWPTCMLLDCGSIMDYMQKLCRGAQKKRCKLQT